MAAYVVSIKSTEVALFQIPSHGYYRSARGDSKEGTKSAADSVVWQGCWGWW